MTIISILEESRNYMREKLILIPRVLAWSIRFSEAASLAPKSSEIQLLIQMFTKPCASIHFNTWRARDSFLTTWPILDLIMGYKAALSPSA